MRVDFAVALAADELWGWPVDVLDSLLELRQRAWAGEISIEEWREQDAALRTGKPAVDTKEVEELQDELLVNGPIDAPEGAHRRLSGRLSALAYPAPSDEELWQELSATHKALTERRHERRVEEIARKNRDRITAWLTRPSSGMDPVTGLPWSWIAHYRAVDDPDLGRVPQYVDMARQLALDGASATDRQRADMIAPGNTSSERKLATSIAALNQNRLTWLPRLIYDAVSGNDELRPPVAKLASILSNAAVQQLLFEETSDGWLTSFDHDEQQA